MKRLILSAIALSIFAAVPAFAQQKLPVVPLPKPADIARVTFKPSDDGFRAYTRKTLLATLPRLVPGFEPFFLSDSSGQEGTFVLKDGTVLEWVAVDDRSLMIISSGASCLYMVAGDVIDKRLSLPLIEDVADVSVQHGPKNVYTRTSLLKTIPGLVPARIYVIVPIKQRGTITLKDGLVLRWASGSKGQLVIYNGKNKVLYGTDTDSELTVPKAENVDEIRADPSGANWYTPETLLKILPQLKRARSTDQSGTYQYGNIALKNDKYINWRAKDAKSLVLYNRSGEVYYELPPAAGPAGALSPGTVKKMLFRERDSGLKGLFEMTLSQNGGDLTGSYVNGARHRFVKGTIETGGKFVLEESDASGKTGSIAGTLIESHDDGDLDLTAVRTGLNAKETDVTATGQVLGFTGGRGLRSHSIRENNSAKRFKVTAEYPEIAGVGGAGTAGFNAAARQLVERPLGRFRRDQTRSDIRVKRSLGANDELYVAYNLKLATDDLVSVEFVLSEYWNGMAHAMTEFRPLTYDLKNRRVLHLADLFKPGSKYLETISAYCIKELRGRPPVNGQKLADGEWADGASPTIENYSNWNLTPRGLVITFNFEQIAPYAGDVNSVLVPYSELKDVIKPGGVLSRPVVSGH